MLYAWNLRLKTCPNSYILLLQVRSKRQIVTRWCNLEQGNGVDVQRLGWFSEPRQQSALVGAPDCDGRGHVPQTSVWSCRRSHPSPAGPLHSENKYSPPFGEALSHIELGRVVRQGQPVDLRP